MAGLKPCPFCGGEASYSTDPEAVMDSVGRLWAYTVTCNKCAASSGLCFSIEQATKAWNRRENDEQKEATPWND